MILGSVEDIRKKSLKNRRALSQDQVIQLSHQIQARFLDRFKVKNLSGLRVAVYRALSDEVNLDALEDSFKEMGWIFHYPRVVGTSSKKIEFVQVSQGAADWQVGVYGIREPASSLSAVSPESLDLVLVPGVAFGQKGERIGMGAAYYDRFLPQAPQALRVSLVFDFQIYSTLPQNSWDQPVHWVLSEKSEFQTSFAQSWLAGKGI